MNGVAKLTLTVTGTNASALCTYPALRRLLEVEIRDALWYVMPGVLRPPTLGGYKVELHVADDDAGTEAGR